jgi:glycosyltransferase involved in cell wall biosynthesis
MIKGISVIICCYNSALRLPNTIKYIAKQKFSAHIDWEIIIVNNASSDNTVEVAQNEWKKYPHCSANFKIVDQPKAGLSAAREKGVEASQYEFILFCDDDNWLVDNYIEISFNILMNNERIGVLGGQGVAVYEVEPPDWFKRFEYGLAVGKQGTESGDITLKKGCVYGAASIYRHSALNKLQTCGFKSLLTDRKGKELSSGGDTELCYALRLAGYKIWYDERLVFSHFIPKERVNWDYIVRLNKGFGKAQLVTQPYIYVLSNSMSNFRAYMWLYDAIYIARNNVIPKLYSLTSVNKGNFNYIQLVKNYTIMKYLILHRNSYKNNVNEVLAFNKRINSGV